MAEDERDGWDRLAEHIGRMDELTKRIADLSRRLIPPAPLPWRVSEWGNVVDWHGRIVVRFYGQNRRDRKAQAKAYLTRYMQQRAGMEAERRVRELELEALQPAQPGRLFDALDVDDMRRVTAEQVAKAVELASGAVCAEPTPGGALSIRPRMYFAPGEAVGRWFPGGVA